MPKVAGKKGKPKQKDALKKVLKRKYKLKKLGLPLSYEYPNIRVAEVYTTHDLGAGKLSLVERAAKLPPPVSAALIVGEKIKKRRAARK